MELKHLSLLIILCLGVQWSSSQILLRHKRNWIIAAFTIDEGYNGSYPYSLGKIEVKKGLSIFSIQGQGLDEEPRNTLKINEKTGEIFVLKPVDHETFTILKLTFQALDKKQNVVETRLGITIDILDANDNVPKFDRDMYEVTIKESTVQGTNVVDVKATDLDSSTHNKKISYRLVSFTPQVQDLKFFLMQRNDIGNIAFKGCLDHEKADKYTLLVEAKDHGQPSLSSTCTVIINIEDGNNHLPVITKQTGLERVTEGEENVLVSRLQVKDEDVKGTAAWRAKFHIQGDTHNNFRITTDPETNEGLLYLEKQLNYEDDPVKNITIFVENEIPYYSCKVVERKTTGLWETKISSTTSIGTTPGISHLSSYNVSLIVEDVNEPPFFKVSNKHVSVHENTKVGTYLETFSATDPDNKGANMVTYVKGEDPAGWITVDSKTGKVTTVKIIDRESSFVKDGVYVVTIHAVDNGEPPLTGTTTLTIVVIDENDNTPSLAVNIIDMCQSNKPSLAKITALDLDGEPYSGPFRFKLLGNVGDKWRIDPQQGYSVNLVKEVKVSSGIYDLLLEVSDLQEKKAVHNLSVTVCSCLNATSSSCTVRKPVGSTAGGGAIGMIILSILMLAGFLFLALLLSCRRAKVLIPEDGCTQDLMPGNIEMLGNDCEVLLPRPDNCKNEEWITTKNKTVMMTPVLITVDNIKSHAEMSQYCRPIQQSQYEMKESERMKNFSRFDSQTYFQRRSIRGNRFAHENSAAMDLLTKRHLYLENVLQMKIQTMMTSLKAQDKELAVYDPHVYADEGDSNHSFELDAISIPEVSFDPDLDFDIRFSTLASICMPDDLQYSTETATVIHRLR
ncbi:cadherin-like protein 26 isoform X2 [Melanotaenia boesemani]|uniref:cadherin-like protein 26 isoform X2 n=1 Tax=Melanotaenia boesemani TaxID=1250792 RepID=UPI001C0508E9|nr:cadherin-like protein 26 isoform X2 [Melanotaenia boesemani]